MMKYFFRQPFFRLSGIFFLPASGIAWLLFLSGIAALVFDFIRIDSHSHSVSDTLMNFVFHLFLVWIFYSVIAYAMGRMKRAA